MHTDYSTATTTGNLNVVDPDGDQLTYTIIYGGPWYGQIAIAPNGDYVYTSYTGVDEYTTWGREYLSSSSATVRTRPAAGWSSTPPAITHRSDSPRAGRGSR